MEILSVELIGGSIMLQCFKIVAELCKNIIW